MLQIFYHMSVKLTEMFISPCIQTSNSQTRFLWDLQGFSAIFENYESIELWRVSIHLFSRQIHPYFGQVQRVMFVGEKFWSCSNINIRRCEIFRSNSNRFLVILVRSSELASKIQQNKTFLFFSWQLFVAFLLHQLEW